jgi:hypothetical protein
MDKTRSMKPLFLVLIPLLSVVLASCASAPKPEESSTPTSTEESEIRPMLDVVDRGSGFRERIIERGQNGGGGPERPERPDRPDPGQTREARESFDRHNAGYWKDGGAGKPRENEVYTMEGKNYIGKGGAFESTTRQDTRGEYKGPLVEGAVKRIDGKLNQWRNGAWHEHHH